MLKERSPIGLKLTFSGRFNVLCPLSPMLQRRATGVICRLLEIRHEPTLGEGNDQLCQLIEALAQPLLGRDIEAVMAEFGRVFKGMADHPRYRWLGPHKGMVHLALASLTNACFDLWAKARGVPLWRLLLDLSPEQVVNTLDLSYLEQV